MSRTTFQRKQRKLEVDVGLEEEEEEEEGEAGGELELNICMQPDLALATNDDRDDSATRHACYESDIDEDKSASSSDSDEDGVPSDTDTSHSSSSKHSALSSYGSNNNSSEDTDRYNDDESNISGDTVLSLFAGSSMSANEALLNVLKLFVEERWTKTSLDKNVKLIHKMLPKPNEFPTSSKDALKKLENLTSSCSESEYLYCDECLQLVETKSVSCRHSGSHSKFYSFPIDEQIKHMFEQRGLASVIDSYREHPSKKMGHICDITDGSEYKKVKDYLPNPYDLILLWNTDGVALSSSSKQDLWPVLCTICEVPPRLRSSFIIVAGVYVSGKDPDMNVFLRPFSDSLKTLWEQGVSRGVRH